MSMLRSSLSRFIFPGVIVVLVSVIAYMMIRLNQTTNSLAMLSTRAAQTSLANGTPVAGSSTSTAVSDSKQKSTGTAANVLVGDARTKSPSPSATGPFKTPKRTYSTAAVWNDLTATPVSEITTRPSYTPLPTETNTPLPTMTFTPTMTPTKSPGLPGLTIEDVTGQLQNDYGFDCQNSTEEDGPTLWMCDLFSGYEVWYHVDIYGTTDVPVNNLLAVVFQTQADDSKAIDVLGSVAALPYAGSDPTGARAWVAATIPGIKDVDDVRQATFGRVVYKLYGGTDGRYLEMGVMPQQ